MLINFNIRVTATIPTTNERIVIDSALERNRGGIVPYIAISGSSLAGVMPVFNLSMANLPPELLTKLSLINNQTIVRVEAGYNDQYSFLAEGAVYLFPVIDSGDNQWVWTADITPSFNFLNAINYTEYFESFRTWQYVMDRYFTRNGLTVNIASSIASQRIGTELSLNVNTFKQLQDFFYVRGWSLTYRDRIISFSDLVRNVTTQKVIKPNQIRPNQYLDFQSGNEAVLQLAGWLPNINSSDYIVMEDEASINAFGTTKGFNGTMNVYKSEFSLSTQDHPIHNLTVRPLTDEPPAAEQ